MKLLNGNGKTPEQEEETKAVLAYIKKRPIEPEPPVETHKEKWQGLLPAIAIITLIFGCFAKCSYDDYLAAWQQNERSIFIARGILEKGWSAHAGAVVWDDIQNAKPEDKEQDAQ